jgi:hypothetical protein
MRRWNTTPVPHLSFRKLGFIEYDGRIRVNKSLLNVILLDQPKDESALEPSFALAAGE